MNDYLCKSTNLHNVWKFSTIRKKSIDIYNEIVYNKFVYFVRS